jgi:hypothetical protein
MAEAFHVSIYMLNRDCYSTLGYCAGTSANNIDGLKKPVPASLLHARAQEVR